MFRKLILSTLMVVAIAGCKSKPKTESAGPGEGNPDQPPKISDVPMEFGAGSDSGTIDGLVTVNFEYDKSSLSADSKKKLQSNAEWIKNNPKVKVQIEGHCDGRGSIEYNVALGERRANSVRSYLASLGVSNERMSVISYGKEKPLDNGDNDKAWAKNRRANFLPVQ